MSTPAERRARTAARLIRKEGEPMQFRRYDLTQNLGEVEQDFVLAATVTAFAYILSVAESIDRGIREGDQIIVVDGTDTSGAPFPGDLTDAWRVVIGGVEFPISPPVAACRMSPTGPAAYFEGLIRTGGDAVATAP